MNEGYAAPEVGLVVLFEAEGGCIDLACADKFLRRRGEVSPHALLEKIHAGEFIAYRGGGYPWLHSRWQFRQQGDLLEGLPDVLKRMRTLSHETNELSPFIFFSKPILS